MAKKATTSKTSKKKNTKSNIEERLEQASTTIDEKIIENLKKVDEERKAKEEVQNDSIEEAIEPIKEMVEALDKIDESKAKIEEITSSQEAKEYITSELEKAKRIKALAQKFLKNKTNTTSWNGINYGNF